MDNIKKDFEILIKNGWLSKESADKYLNDADLIGAINVSTSPKPENIFNALKLLPLNKTHVVILGKDPYPNPNHAQGIAFSSLDKTTPDSLKNIFKAIDKAYGSNLFENAKNNLLNWVNQGVLLLNTSLTFEKTEDKKLQIKNQLRHTKIWKNFIKEIINKILFSKNNMVMFLWGNDAHNMVYKLITNKEFQKTNHSRIPQIVPNTNIMLLMTSHPSPLSVNRGGDFLKSASEHFLVCDKFLAKNKIDWTRL